MYRCGAHYQGRNDQFWILGSSYPQQRQRSIQADTSLLQIKCKLIDSVVFEACNQDDTIFVVGTGLGAANRFQFLLSFLDVAI